MYREARRIERLFGRSASPPPKPEAILGGTIPYPNGSSSHAFVPLSPPSVRKFAILSNVTTDAVEDKRGERRPSGMAMIRSNVNTTDEDTPTQKVASLEAFPNDEVPLTRVAVELKTFHQEHKPKDVKKSRANRNVRSQWARRE